jgi:hypothetical protein
MRYSLFLACTVLFLANSCIQKKSERVRILSVPKAGSHLILKTARGLTSDPSLAFKHLDRNDGKRLHFHKRTPYLLNIRDPRDIFVSLIDWIDHRMEGYGIEPPHIHEGKPCFNHCNYIVIFSQWLEMTFSEKLYAVIIQDPSICIFPGNTLAKNFEKASELMSWPRVLTIRFENLVGAQGGGNQESQLKELQKICAFYHIHLSQEELENIAFSLWGDAETVGEQNTFNVGRIGRWKECYQEHHIAAFKHYWNQYLIDWGYETTPFWHP